jgi:hypothetical protein
MLVTGRSLIVSGMMMFPPRPVHPVMMIAPWLVMKVNWPCTTVGSVNSSPSTKPENFRDNHVVQAVLILLIVI